jgi:anti-sigma B factor antagonist
MSYAAQATMSIVPEKSDAGEHLQCAVIQNGTIAVVRVKGRGNFGVSMPLKSFTAKILESPSLERFIVDLQFCESMDSTFMGVLAGLAMQLLRKGKQKLMIYGANDQCKRLLKTLGVLTCVELAEGRRAEIEACEARLAGAEAPLASKVDQILLTLQAHQQLASLDQENEVRFQAVIEFLEKSLQEERQQGH